MRTKLHTAKLTSNVPPHSFTCGNSSIDEKISNSYELTLLQHAYAYQVIISNTIVGYYMLKLRRIDLENCLIDNEEISDYYVTPCTECFSMHLEYIAVATVYQHRGIGKTLMGIIIKYLQNLSQSVPIRLLTLSALREKYDWYRQIGFLPFSQSELDSTSPTIEMYMDLLIDKNRFDEYYNKCGGV